MNSSAAAAVPRERRLGWGWLAGSLGIGAALRLWLAFHDDGLYWPDEIYQSLEPAHRLVFGYGLVAWEFIEGARNWALPAVVAVVLKLVAGPATDPATYLAAVRVFFCAVGVATAGGVYKLARILGAGSVPAAVGASLFALGGPFIYFAPRAMSETASALPVVFGLALALTPGARRWVMVAGASLLGVAVLLRLQNGLFCVGLLGILAGRRDWKRAAEAGVTLVAWAVLFGLLDRLTWGEWFHSAFVYLRFNLIQHGAEQWGTASFPYYFRVLFSSLGVLAVLLAAFALAAAPRARGLLLVAGAFVLLHAWTAHKEYRFILPVVPVLCALAAVGLDAPWIRSQGSSLQRLLWGATAALALWSGLHFHDLTFGELGQYENLKPLASAYDDSGPVNRLLLAAFHQGDLCGLKVEAVHLAWTGGYSYLHRQVPLYPNSGPPRESRRFNYVISGLGGPGEVVATEQNLALVRIFPGGCAPDVGYSWRLP